MPGSPDLFRPAAWEAFESTGRPGAPLDLAGRWIGLTYHLLVVTVVVGLLFVLFGRAGDYAHGPAVVRVEGEGRLDLVTHSAGIVMTVDVRAGQRVSAGQTLARFHDEDEVMELARLDREQELKVVRILLHPGDEATRQSLASLRAARDQAAARLAERRVIAPRAGVVRNLRARPGQLLAPGDSVLTLTDEVGAAHGVVALVPGRYRPMLRPGLPLRFVLDGYPQVAAALEVDSVGDEVVGPSEIRRALGAGQADSLPIEGALVLVHARLTDPTFAFEGQRFRFYDGIPGQVDVKVGSVRIAALLFPAWKELFRGR